MYFHKEKNNTNIDSEFQKKKNIKISLPNFNLNKPIIIGILLILLITITITILVFPLFKNEKVTITLNLKGEEEMTLYQGTDYIEPGYNAYNSKNEDLTFDIIIKSTIDTSKIGEYQIIYTIGDITKIRKVNVIAKEYTYIKLKKINNSEDVYLKLNEEYKEPGYQVLTSAGTDLTSQVQVSVTGMVDTSKKGNYVLTYSLIDSDNVTITATRTVFVMDAEIRLSLNNKEYTNGSVTINVEIEDDYFDYMILPNGEKISEKKHSYIVKENGTYSFKVYNIKGISKETSIDVNNIDKTAPLGTCTIEHGNTGSNISISSSDTSGIQKYIYNNKSYTTSTIKISTYIDNAKITIYDNANNQKEITCTQTPYAFINNIQKDGVIITINAKKISTEIKGYYFSYNNQRPNKNTGGYIETNKESIDVVRLPGTTYVWIEDIYGKISAPKTIYIDNDALLITTDSGYKILKNTKLSSYLSNNGWSISGLNNLMARSVRAAGIYTKEAAATSVVAFQTTLAQKYKIKLPYWWGGKHWSSGANGEWGKYYITEEGPTTYEYYGLDCSGFTTWAYVNAGYNVISTPNVSKYPAYWWGYKYTKFSKENGELGDFLINDDHIKLIVGKTNTAFITAEAKGKSAGMVISLHSYSNPNGYKIQKGEELMNAYNKYDKSEIPTGI